MTFRGVLVVACLALLPGCGSSDNRVSSSLQGEPGSGVAFLTLNAFNHRVNATWGPVLTDIMNHEVPGENNDYDDLVTKGHETSHGIHSYVRNSMRPSGTPRSNGFYVLENRAVLVAEPNIRKSQIAAYVPASLRESRFSSYITGQSDWDDTPLYVWDEWNAYVNGGATGVDIEEHGLWHAGWRDAVMGPLEFGVYALASGQAVKALDPAYFARETQFKEFLAFNLERTMTVYRKGAAMTSFRWDKQEAYYQKLRTSADAEALRAFARATYGADWCTRVMGF